MIVRHIPMKAAHKSSFGQLVKYLEDEQEKEERVGEVTITNCHSLNTKDAILEVLNTQAMNKRAESDKTYHLLVSFAPDESVSTETLKAIESRLCAALGFAEHQRISVVHHDTDNLHIHIAINKIHPVKHTIKEPYYPYKTIGDLCQTFEKEYGLVATNHQAKKNRSENLADDLEKHSGVESLLGWIKDTCAENLLTANSWEAIHAALSANCLTLQPRGNGFVITNADGLMVKASSVARELSKPRLEARLGVYQGNAVEGAITPKASYSARPISKGFDTTELYAQYQSDRAKNTDRMRYAKGVAYTSKNKLVQDAKNAAKLKRDIVKLMRISRASKKILYALIHRALLKRLAAIHTDYRDTKQQVAVRYSRRTWADWLREQAALGNQDAIKALRHRAVKQGFTDKDAFNIGADATSGETIRPDSITKEGTVIYRVDGSTVRDDGKQIFVSRSTQGNAIAVALALAIDKYGTTIKVSGSDKFKAQALVAAVVHKFDVHFDDPLLEAKRIQLTGGLDEKTENDRGRSRGGSRGYARADYRGRGHAPGYGHGTGDGKKAMDNQRNPKKSKREREAIQANRMRNLSKRGMDSVRGGSEVLLSDNVPRHLEQGRPSFIPQMRRGVSWRGLTNPDMAAAEKYILEREATRAKGVNIPLHRLYSDMDKGEQAAFMGLRHIDGTTLALLNKQVSNETLVMPVSEQAAKSLKRHKVGDNVPVPENGIFDSKRGKSR